MNNNDVNAPVNVTGDESYNTNAARPTIAPSNLAPQANKIHSYSQQLRARHHHIRKHSLDEDYRVSDNIDHYYDDSSDDDDFYTSASTSATSGSARIENAFLYDNDCVSGVGSFRGDDQSEMQKPMPEFIGNGGGVGMFKAPMRAAVHPASPPFLELRPHPLKETQVNKCLRTIECTETQLWAGQENGVRFWNFEDSFEPGCGLGKRAKRGDEDAAPFRESCNSPPTFCLIIDSGKKLVWTGHKDGKIRSWKMDKCLRDADKDDDTPFKEGLSWQAHHGPVLSMIFTSYGDIWSGGEGGVIKIWPWETIEKSLSMSKEEKHMAALLVERSFIDLKTQVTVNGVCGISSQDVKCLLVDNVRAKVWCAYPQSFSLWDARTRELSKVFNIDGQIETRIDSSSQGQDQQAVDQDETKEKKTTSTSTKKDKSSHGFLQRSRNALKEATGFVRRAATKGSFVEDNKRTEALVVTLDGMIWSGCTNGLLVQWDGNGNRLRDILHHPCGVLCFCTSGTRIYVGYVSGMVQILDLEGNLIAGWIAHGSPVIKLVVGGGYIFSLATHGGIRGWHVTSPGPLDNILRSELVGKEATYTRKDNVTMLVGTWNVGEGKASLSSLQLWLGSTSSDVGIVVVGLQEVEMGAGFLAMSAAKETVGIEGSIGGQLWLDTIGKALDEGTTFERMGSRQLAGLLISLWVRKSIRTHVGDVDAGAVACGFGRAIGNKGAVGLRIRVYDRIMCFVNCHYAAHLEAVNRRNADFNHVYRNMAFTRSSSSILNNAAVGVSSNVQVLRGTNTTGGASTENTKSELTDADMVVFLGDFNYRLHSISYDEARDFVSQRCFDWLREKDQLRAEMKGGKVFQGMREAVIRFPPTYKFEKRKPGLAGYDSGEKKRIPAWCDRILYRDNRSGSEISCSLECPVISSILQYEACMDVLDSDHKPVRCKFHVQICHVDRSVRRHGLGKIIKSSKNVISFLEQLCSYVPETCMSMDNLCLQNREISHLRIINKCKNDKAVFKVFCEGQSTMNADGEPSELHLKASYGFPRWLVVTPASGIIDPDQSVELLLQYEDYLAPEESAADRTHQQQNQNHSCEDARDDKEVMLVVNVRGSCSTEWTNHQVKVRHCFTEIKTGRASRSNSRSSSTNEKIQEGSSVHDLRQSSSSWYDVRDDTRPASAAPTTEATKITRNLHV